VHEWQTIPEKGVIRSSEQLKFLWALTNHISGMAEARVVTFYIQAEYINS